MATLKKTPTNYTGMNVFTINSSYPITNAYADSSSSNYTRLTTSSSSTCQIYFTGFDFSSIPSNVSINSVTVKFKANVSNTTRVSSATFNVTTGITKKGTDHAFRSTSASTYTMTSDNWTRSELDDIRIVVDCKTTWYLSTTYINVYGMDIEVDYTLLDGVKGFVKQNGSWKPYSRIWKKENGTWNEYNSASDVLDSGTNYKFNN